MTGIAINRRAWHDFEILERFEAGLVLTGEEIKAIRAGRISLSGSYAKLLGQPAELFLVGAHITTKLGDPGRSRKLLVHRRELAHLAGKTRQRGLTLVPLRLYLKRNRAKIEIGIGRGRKRWDRREVLKKKAIEKELRG